MLMVVLSSGDDEAENVEKEENMQFTMLSKKGSKIQVTITFSRN
jgi:hypothetical protein